MAHPRPYSVHPIFKGCRVHILKFVRFHIVYGMQRAQCRVYILLGMQHAKCRVCRMRSVGCAECIVGCICRATCVPRDQHDTWRGARGHHRESESALARYPTSSPMRLRMQTYSVRCEALIY